MFKRIKISIIGTNGLPARYGGFETLADYLSKYLSHDYDVIVYCSGSMKEKRKYYNNSRLVHFPFKANGWQSLIYDAISIIHSYFTCDVLIVLGFSGVMAFPLNFIFKKRIVFNIGGIEWKKVRGAKSFSRIEILSKKIFEHICVAFSSVVVADNKAIFNYVKERYKKRVVLAEYGGDHAKYEPIDVTLIEKYPFLDKQFDLTISRAQEDMNIHIVLQAYERLMNRTIVVISNWEISDYGKGLKARYEHKYVNIILLNSIYNLKELNAIRGNAGLYIHTHSLCGTAPSLVEAMSLKLPIVCFDVPTNRSATEEKSYYFTDYLSLRNIIANLDEGKCKALQDSMFEIAARRYTWKRIVGLYKNCLE